MYVSHVDRFRNGLNLDPGSHICCTRIEGFEVRQRRRIARIYCNLVTKRAWGWPGLNSILSSRLRGVPKRSIVVAVVAVAATVATKSSFPTHTNTLELRVEKR